MGKYFVTLKVIEIYHIEVEAENESKARETAWEKFDALTDVEKAVYHYDSDSASEVDEA